jgi:hypothetical protein
MESREPDVVACAFNLKAPAEAGEHEFESSLGYTESSWLRPCLKKKRNRKICGKCLPVYVHGKSLLCELHLHGHICFPTHVFLCFRVFACAATVLRAEVRLQGRQQEHSEKMTMTAHITHLH